MKADPILRELGDIKDGLSEECGHDLRRLLDKLRMSQKSHGNRLVNRVKRRSVTSET